MAPADVPEPPPAGAEARRPVSLTPWAERHRLLMVDQRHRFALAFQVGIHRSAAPHDAASFHCVVFEPGQLPVVIVDNEIPVPADRWELRTSGLWADNICETPLRHWSYGLEAFGLAIDDGREMEGRGYGRRTPLGWELEFESSPELARPLELASQWPSGLDAGGAYSQVGHADGLLLFAGRSPEIQGPAVRQHWWGPVAAAPLAGLDRAVDTAFESDDDPAIGTGAGSPSGREAVSLPMADALWRVAQRHRGLSSRTVLKPDSIQS